MLQLEVSGCSQASVGISFVAVTMKLEQVCEKIGDVPAEMFLVWFLEVFQLKYSIPQGV